MVAKIKNPKKLPPLPPILSDEDCVEARRRAAEAQQADVRPLWREADRVRGVYQVGSTQRQGEYTVEFRDPGGFRNSCTCADFRMNRLGTCKHIERVRQFVQHLGVRVVARAADLPTDRVHVWLDTTGEAPCIRWMLPASPLSKMLKVMKATQGSTRLRESMERITKVVESLSPGDQRRVYISPLVREWAERELSRDRLDARRVLFEAEVAAGQASDNPVRLPLFPYQKEGMKFLAFRGRAMLADEMGLGKTVQAIAAAELLRSLGLVQRVLVICPTSLKAEWEEQLALFTGIRAHLLFGSRAARLEVYREKPPWLVCNYEQMIRDVDDVNTLLQPDLVILDEAQRIKNWPTKTAKAIKNLNAPFAFVLTGTPLENRIDELYSLCEFVDPLVLGNLERFQREFMRWDVEGKRYIPQNLAELHQRVAPILLRRKKADVETELPPRTDKTYFVSMTTEQFQRYDEVSLQVGRLLTVLKRRKLTPRERDRLQLLLAQMRMLCDTPYILDSSCRDCPKLIELDSILQEILAEPEAKVIIFSEWVRMLELVAELLDRRNIGYVEHHGGVHQQQRRININQFKRDPDCRIFLSSEAGGVGLNLQNAHVVINLDLPWNPAKLEQRIARAWRKHQLKTVRVINLVTEKSLEAAMIDKLASKSALAAAVVDGVEATQGVDAGDSFLKRVGELFEACASFPAPEPETLPERLRARHGDAMLGVLTSSESTTCLAVARDEAAVGAMRQSVTAEAPAIVISAATLDVLKQLRDAGLIQFAASLETQAAIEGFDPGVLSPPPKKPNYSVAAKEHWAKGDEARTAAHALHSVGLDHLARPHLHAAVENASDALQIFHTGTKTPTPSLPPELQEWLNQHPRPTLDDIPLALGWMKQVELELSNQRDA